MENKVSEKITMGSLFFDFFTIFLIILAVVAIMFEVKGATVFAWLAVFSGCIASVLDWKDGRKFAAVGGLICCVIMGYAIVKENNEIDKKQKVNQIVSSEWNCSNTTTKDPGHEEVIVKKTCQSFARMDLN